MENHPPDQQRKPFVYNTCHQDIANTGASHLPQTHPVQQPAQGHAPVQAPVPQGNRNPQQLNCPEGQAPQYAGLINLISRVPHPQQEAFQIYTEIFDLLDSNPGPQQPVDDATKRKATTLLSIALNNWQDFDDQARLSFVSLMNSFQNWASAKRRGQVVDEQRGYYYFFMAMASGFEEAEIRQFAFNLKKLAIYLIEGPSKNEILKDPDLRKCIRVLGFAIWANSSRKQTSLHLDFFQLPQLSEAVEEILPHKDNQDQLQRFLAIYREDTAENTPLSWEQMRWVFPSSLQDRITKRLVEFDVDPHKQMLAQDKAEISNIDALLSYNKSLFTLGPLGYWFKSMEPPGDKSQEQSVLKSIGKSLRKMVQAKKSKPLTFTLSFQIFEELEKYQIRKRRDAILQISEPEVSVISTIAEEFFTDYLASLTAQGIKSLVLLPERPIDFDYLQNNAVVIPEGHGISPEEVAMFFAELKALSKEDQFTFLCNISNHPDRDQLYDFKTLRFYLVRNEEGELEPKKKSEDM